MPNLIHRPALLPRQPPLRVKRVLFQEEPDLVAGRQEVVVPDVVVVARRELGLRPNVGRDREFMR